MSKASETVLEINLNHLEHNYHYLRSKILPKTKFLGVVKAFAYGSDSVKIAKKLEKLGADYLAVAYVNEGVQLRDAGLRIPILVLHPQPINFDLAGIVILSCVSIICCHDFGGSCWSTQSKSLFEESSEAFGVALCCFNVSLNL